jgi:hypothetical protein
MNEKPGWKERNRFQDAALQGWQPDGYTLAKVGDGKISSWSFVSELYNELSRAVKDNRFEPHMLREYRDDLRAISRSEHFSLPDGVRILGGSMQALAELDEIRLPYPSITVACRQQSEETDAICDVVMICEELEAADHFKFIAYEYLGRPDNGIGIRCYIRYGRSGSFALSLSRVFIQRHDTVKVNEKGEVGAVTFADFAYPRAADEFREIMPMSSTAEISDRIDFEGAQLAIRLLELIQALSCTNIVAVPASPKRRRPPTSRRKKGPLFQTKRLEIIAPISRSANTVPSGGNRQPPRAHLRRGHIRRLPTGNIWINACTVGELQNGFLHKDYGVKGQGNE